MQLTSIAWNQVKSETISKHFRKAGVVKVSIGDAVSDADEEEELDETDEDWSTCSQDSDDILHEFIARNSDDDSDETDNIVDEIPVKLREALSALEITKRYVMSKVLDDESMQIVSEYERLIYECSSTKKKQTAIESSSFKPN